MDITKRIKTMLQEAELYHSHGLLEEALVKYNKAESLVRSYKELKNRMSLIDSISKKIQILKADIQRIENAPKKPELPSNVQDLIKKLFSFSPDKNEDARALEGAIALAKFGQFKRAILEFKTLLKRNSVRVPAAKNILRCYITFSSIDDAIGQYEQWLSESIFSSSQMDKLRIFLASILRKEGIEKRIPQAKIPESDIENMTTLSEIEQINVQTYENDELEIKGDDDLDINSIGITLDNGPLKGQVFEFKVRFQLGRVVSLLISNRDKDLIENFKVGTTINNVQYYSNVAFFTASGLVTAVKEIKVGPLRGDTCVDIEIEIN